MMLDYLGYQAAARSVERAIEAACEAGEVTVDLGGKLSTDEAGRAICSRIT
jgi:isocitrate/isopropylmalate dehydrogenase